MNVTIYDVAKEANVSITTVSRVLNNNLNVKETTRLKVLEAIKKLDFYPNINASNLTNNTTKTIGALLPKFDDLTFPDNFNLTFLIGIQNVLAKHDYNLLLINENTHDYQSEPLNYVKVIQSKKIDGFISWSSKVQEDNIKKFNDKNFPIVLIGEDFKSLDICRYILNISEYTKIALGHLIKYGHTNIAIVYYAITEEDRKIKLRMIKKIYDKNNLNFYQDGAINGADYRSNIHLKLKELLMRKRYTAFFVDSVYYARRLAEVAYELGLKIPNDISIICFEYIEDEALRIYPPISSILISGMDLGQQCTEMLFECIESKNIINRKRMLQVNFYDRNSIKKIK